MLFKKFFENSKEYTRNFLLNNLIEQYPHSLIELLFYPVGNYVIQKILIAEKGELYIKILKITINGISEIQKVIFGNKLIVKLIINIKN